MQRSTITAIALALSLVSAPAFADPRSRDEIHIAVSPADLASDQAVGALYQRIVQAADTICSQGLNPYITTQRSCRVTAIAEAVERAHIPELTAYHRQSHENAMVASR
jgi:UrcA family protein